MLTVLRHLAGAVRAVKGAAELVTLAIFEFILHDEQDAASHSDWYTCALDIRMMYLVGGKQRGTREWMRLLKDAGWTWKRIIPCVDSPLSIVEANVV